MHGECKSFMKLSIIVTDIFVWSVGFVLKFRAEACDQSSLLVKALSTHRNIYVNANAINLISPKIKEKPLWISVISSFICFELTHIKFE